MREMLGLLLNVGFVAKAVLFFLVILSVVSWAVIFEKWRSLSKMRKDTRKFMQLFQRTPSWEELYQYSRECPYSPLAQVVRRIYQDNLKWKENTTEKPEFHGLPEHDFSPVKGSAVPVLSIMETASAREISRMERRLIILSTTVSVSPFLGLLGTVWGIMNAFISIGITGSASLASVGPGIAEALITTAAGLAVAIPALIAYNFFVDRIRRWDETLDTFIADLYRIRQRENVG